MLVGDCLSSVVDDGCRPLSTMGMSSNSGGSVGICLSRVLGFGSYVFGVE